VFCECRGGGEDRVRGGGGEMRETRKRGETRKKFFLVPLVPLVPLSPPDPVPLSPSFLNPAALGKNSLVQLPQYPATAQW